MLYGILITTSVLFLAIRPAEAQINRSPYGVKLKQGFAQQALEKFAGAGTIAAIEPGRILMVTNFNEKCLIWLMPQTKIITTGEARQEFLHPGLLVEFKAELDKHRNVTGTIEQLTLISASPEKIPGIFPLDGDQTDSSGGQTSPAGLCTVVGRIAALHNNTLQVNVGHGTLLAELSPNAKIRLEINDYSMARKGDKITVSGMKMRGAANQVQALQVKIELAEALAGMNTKSLPLKSQLQRSSKSIKSKLLEGLPVPAEEK